MIAAVAVPVSEQTTGTVLAISIMPVETTTFRRRATTTIPAPGRGTGKQVLIECMVKRKKNVLYVSERRYEV